MKLSCIVCAIALIFAADPSFASPALELSTNGVLPLAAAAPEISIQQPAGTELTDGISIVSFGNATLGTTGVSLTFTICNFGDADLTGLEIAVDGLNAEDFVVSTTGMATTLAPAESTTFSVTFTPGEVGSCAAAIHIASNDSDENLFDVALEGTGQPGLAEALDLPGATWTTGGNAVWTAQSAITHDAVDAARSGPIGNNQASHVSTAISGRGILTFWWSVSSEAGWDNLRFMLDGAEIPAVPAISGNVGWVQKTVAIPSGVHDLRWVYSKDGSLSYGADAGWVDQVVFTPIPPQPTISVSVPPNPVPLANGQTFSLGAVPSDSPTITTFTISNTGELPLTGFALSKDGPASDAILIDKAGMEVSLAPGASTTFSVSIEPEGIGSHSAAIHIASNDPANNPFDIILAWQTPPPNDAFADRTNLGSVAATAIEGSLVSTTSEVWNGEPDCSEYAIWGPEDDFTVWYEWTAPAGVQWGRIELSGPSVPSMASVYTGSSIDDLTKVALQWYQDPTAPNYLSFQAVPGTKYMIRVAVWAPDYYEWLWSGSNVGEPNMNFTLGLSSLGTPVTAEDFVWRGRAWLEKGTRSGLTYALADFNTAVTLDASHEEARFLRAFTRLINLEAEPAFVQLLGDLDIYRSGLLQRGGQLYLPFDADGILSLPPGTSTASALAWIDTQLLPRLTLVRADLDLITSDDFQTRLSQRETGAAGTLVDKGDVLVIKALTHGVEMLFQLLFTYDLDVSMDAVMRLQATGTLNAQQVLTTASSLMKFGASDRRHQFATALQAMNADYQAASNFIRTKRTDPVGLLTENLSADPAKEAQTSETLAALVASLDGQATCQGIPLNLSRLIVTKMSIRDWLPRLKGDDALAATLPDPTFDNILPAVTADSADSFIYRIGRLWGYAQYAEEYGDLLEKIFGVSGLPNDDPDRDGNSNFLEWLRGSSPIDPNVMWQDFSRHVLETGKPEVQISFARRIDLRDWKLIVAVSDDLNQWDRTETQIEMVGDPVDNGDGWTETVTYRLTDVAALADRKFLRVEAQPK